MPLRLLKGIRHFKNNQFKENEQVYTALSKGQAPDVLFFGCIDSRIDHRSITNSQLGELLVARNPGNIIPPYSATPSGEASSSEFALQHLEVSEIIVCGHSHCGAMKGLMTPGVEKILPNTAAWLSHAKEALDHVHQHHPDLNEDPSLKLKSLTQNNILLQIEHLKTHPAVAKRLAEGKLKIHGWYYEFEKGEIYIYNSKKNTFVSFEETVDELAQEKLKELVEEEALNYLNELTPQENSDYYKLLKQFEKISPVAALWPHIKMKVSKKAEEELGELYQTSKGTLSIEFTELLNKGPLIPVRTVSNKYQEIERLFTQALAYQPEIILSHNHKKLLAAVAQLKSHTLKQFAQGNKLYDFSQCMCLAKSTKELITKLEKNKATAADVDAYIDLSKTFKPSASTHLLKTILISIAALALALISGFLLGGVPGAGAGVIGTIAALGFWTQRSDPLAQISKTAERMRHEASEESYSLLRP
ncbi:carbonic anhydrase [Legionella sp. km772]|uniref:carbonic anhydrase n=1 Tax=Legionella sp. km772 TaxID=2498111 RepID=UPI000F8D8BC0|nr:carbonic anhydrase [Legionella sp. km772]RUR06514.1 carbonic anhydrase [Legionella sp. km772]